jgi:hypothetical protein
MKNLGIIILLIATVATSVFSRDINGELELLKGDVRGAKREIIALNIVIKDSVKSAEFWSIYNKYEEANKKEVDKTMNALREYAANYEKLTPEIANELGKDLFVIEKAQTKLLEATYKEMVKKVGAIDAIRFVQLEGRIKTLLRLQLASEIPLVLPEAPAPAPKAEEAK